MDNAKCVLAAGISWGNSTATLEQQATGNHKNKETPAAPRLDWCDYRIQPPQI